MFKNISFVYVRLFLSACGNSSSEPEETFAPHPHDFDENQLCRICGEKIEIELTFEYIKEEDTYRAIGSPGIYKKDLVIPATYKGKPVM